MLYYRLNQKKLDANYEILFIIQDIILNPNIERISINLIA